MTTKTKFVKELYNEDLVYSSVLFGMGFWIDDQGLFISAPEFKDGSLDVDSVRFRHFQKLLHNNQVVVSLS